MCVCVGACVQAVVVQKALFSYACLLEGGEMLSLPIVGIGTNKFSLLLALHTKTGSRESQIR